MSLTPETKQLLAGFERYMEAKRMLFKTVIKYRRRVDHFIEWIQDKQTEAVRYTEMMEYIRYCKSEHRTASNVNQYLRSVRHFFDYLNKEGNRFLNPIEGYNPAKGIHIRGIYHRLRHDYLKELELEGLYDKYEGKHKVLLGLLVYQGLKLIEVEKLEKIHVNLKKGTIYIPKTTKGNSRTLKLKSAQLYDLMQHISNLEGQNLLRTYLQNDARALCRKLRQINPKVRNSSHLRGSRISYWLRNYDIREAQYLAGHNTVSGTEKYRQVNLEDLQNQVNKFHPLK